MLHVIKLIHKLKLIHILTLILGSLQVARAQWIVNDPTLLAQMVLNTYVSHQQLDTARLLVTQLGDAAAITHIPGADSILQSLGGRTAGGTLGDLQKVCTGQGVLRADANGFYRPIGDTVVAPDGTTIQRRVQPYRKFEAAHLAAANYAAVLSETQTRRDAVLQGIRATNEAVSRAATIAEAQKLAVVATMQLAALSAIDGERSAALGNVLVQCFDNKTDDAKQEQARLDDRSLEFKVASKKFTRFLTPVSSGIAK